jgi:hypothetical protein
LDTKKRRQFGKYDRLTRLEGRMEYLERVIYRLFELTEQLLTRLEKTDDKETKPPYSTDRLLTLLTFLPLKIYPLLKVLSEQ